MAKDSILLDDDLEIMIIPHMNSLNPCTIRYMYRVMCITETRTTQVVCCGQWVCHGGLMCYPC